MKMTKTPAAPAQVGHNKFCFRSQAEPKQRNNNGEPLEDPPQPTMFIPTYHPRARAADLSSIHLFFVGHDTRELVEFGKLRFCVQFINLTP